MTGLDEDTLAAIAIQLVGRVRDDDPEANGRWLLSLCPEPEHWWQLCFVLAAAVPTDQPWRNLTAWARAVYNLGGDGRPDTAEKILQRRRDLLDALSGAPGRNKPRERNAA